MSKRVLGLLTVLGTMLFANNALAQANTVYIDQIGNNSVIDVTQTGSNNIVGTSVTGTRLYGNNQTVNITQIGSNNVAALNIQGNGATVSSDVTGSLNSLTINCGAGTGTLAACTDSNITVDATGDSNTMTVTAGAKNTSTTTITGDTNSVDINSQTNNLLGAKSDVTVAGGINTVTVSQNGAAGANGFDAKIDVTGSSNTIGVTQSGSVDSIVNIKSVGSNNTITVNSGN